MVSNLKGNQPDLNYQTSMQTLVSRPYILKDEGHSRKVYKTIRPDKQSEQPVTKEKAFGPPKFA